MRAHSVTGLSILQYEHKMSKTQLSGYLIYNILKEILKLSFSITRFGLNNGHHQVKRVKFTPEQAMKAKRGNRCTDLFFL
jgi:hypothetical protein